MKKIAFLFLLLFAFSSLIAQENQYEKTNTIFYGDLSLGVGSIFEDGSDYAAIGIMTSFNYQHKRSLYTFRYNFLSDFILGPISIDPVRITNVSIHEWGALYGRRWLYEGSSISISGGISLNHYRNNTSQGVFERTYYMGFPVETNMRFFKKKKKPFHAFYGLVPVGKPTTFGRSWGLKISGNFSKRNFFLIGVTYGLGTHKYY